MSTTTESADSPELPALPPCIWFDVDYTNNNHRVHIARCSEHDWQGPNRREWLKSRADAARHLATQHPVYDAAILATRPYYGLRFTTSDGADMEWVADMATGLSGYCQVEAE